MVGGKSILGRSKRHKVAVITGGSRGLGRHLSIALAGEGYRVVICARDRKHFTLLKKIGAITTLVADVTIERDMRMLVRFVLSRFGHINVWINNAGAWLPPSPIEDINLKAVRATFEPNVFGLMCATKSILPQMKKQKSGTILTIISTSGLSGRPFLSGYAASKWSARGFVESLREECRGSRIRVLAAYPGGMQTEMFKKKIPSDFKLYMNPAVVAEKIVRNLGKKKPRPDLIIRRPRKH